MYAVEALHWRTKHGRHKNTPPYFRMQDDHGCGSPSPNVGCDKNAGQSHGHRRQRRL